jgi:hypothetical protein
VTIPAVVFRRPAIPAGSTEENAQEREQPAGPCFTYLPGRFEKHRQRLIPDSYCFAINFFHHGSNVSVGFLPERGFQRVAFKPP